MSDLERGEIWFASLDPIVGHEQAGYRPVLIVSPTGYNQGGAGLVTVLPMTTQLRQIGIHLTLHPPDVDKPCRILTDQIRAISKDRLRRKVGKLENKTMKQVDQYLRRFLQL